MKNYIKIYLNYIITPLLGKDYQELYGLNKENIYDPTVNPSTSLEFSTAGFRVLHSLIPVQFKYVSARSSNCDQANNVFVLVTLFNLTLIMFICIYIQFHEQQLHNRFIHDHYKMDVGPEAPADRI